MIKLMDMDMDIDGRIKRIKSEKGCTISTRSENRKERWRKKGEDNLSAKDKR